MRALLLTTALMVSSLAVADTGALHVYAWNGKSYTKVGTMTGEGSGNAAIVCVGGNCDLRTTCDTCHTGSSRPTAYSNPALHEREFARRAIQVGSTPLVVRAGTLIRTAGGLTLKRPSTERAEAFPADALVLPDRTGAPSFVFYKGDQPPRP